jgi:hypothetical protein
MLRDAEETSADNLTSVDELCNGRPFRGIYDECDEATDVGANSACAWADTNHNAPTHASLWTIKSFRRNHASAS